MYSHSWKDIKDALIAGVEVIIHMALVGGGTTSLLLVIGSMAIFGVVTLVYVFIMVVMLSVGLYDPLLTQLENYLFE